MKTIDTKKYYKIPTFLKWAGGKRRILNDLVKLMPAKFDSYFEPFLGGGAAFFFIKEVFNPKKIVISDINEDLILTYKAVRDFPEELIKNLKYFKKNNSSDFFYKVRSKFNLKKFIGVKRCAAFIYLNKTCYNGLFRVNSKNEFNVPYGKYNNPEIFSKENILYASKLLKRVIIKHQDYRKIVKDVSSGSFVYLDPCYDPIKRTSFVSYTPKNFSDSDRVFLADFVHKLKEKGADVLLSNNDLVAVRELYPNFFIDEIFAPRSIGSRASDRKKVMELAIHTYPIANLEE